MSHGLYFHIPFCQAKCNYCHFISMPYEPTAANRYIKALLRELECWDAESACSAEIDSIYIGGGTPSIVPEEYINDILGLCWRQFRILDICEVSLEANPGTISNKRLEVYRKSGVNRISVGAQSFVDQELSSIGRLHNANMIFDAVKQLKEKGFSNITLDLMLGLPHQTRLSWKKNLETIRFLEIPHVSVYMLDLDDQCPLYSMIAEGSLCMPEEDLISDLYLETIDTLSSYGYLQYEISNFAQPGYACRHNLKYWMRDPVQGFGLGSHSFDGSSRYANKPSINDYLEAIESGGSPVDWRESISTEQALQEKLFLGLRLTEGINWKQLREFTDGENLAQYEVSFRDLSDRGFIKWDGEKIRLTSSGMLISNEIFQLFV